MSKKYNFDIIKSQTSVVVSALFVFFFPLFLWQVLRTPSLKLYIPDFLYGDIFVPSILFALIPAFLIYNKKHFFWKEMEILLDDVKAELTLNGKKYMLDELDYYEFHPGSLVTSGSRDVIYLKFRLRKKVTIIPCRTSNGISDYDAFVNDFQVIASQYFSEDKERVISNSLKYFLISVLVAAHVVFFYIYISNARAATKMIPGLLMAYAIFLPQIFKRKRRSRNLDE